MKYTPGPWTYRKSSDGTTTYVEAVYGENHWLVAEVAGRGAFQNEVNARLIASAPQLAEALLEARRYVVGAYECAFPDAAENEQVLREIDDALRAAGIEVRG